LLQASDLSLENNAVDHTFGRPKNSTANPDLRLKGTDLNEDGP
jgi:hypothetical protein